MKKIKKIINKITLDKLTVLFLSIQPLLEIYYLYHFEGVTGLFSFSPSTIIRLLIYFLIFIYFMAKNKIKDYKIPFIYGVIVLVYFIIHHFVLVDNSYFFLGNYSIIGELFYIVRLTLPVLSIYVYYKTNYKSDSIYKGLNISTAIFSSIMIFTNIFMISLASYYSTVYEVETNIFGWIFAEKNNYNYYQLATKGIFNFTNCLSTAYTLILTLLLIKLRKSEKKIDYINIVLLIISLFMLGSRVSSYFPLIILVLTLIINIVINIIRKKKIEKKYLLKIASLIIITLLILPIAPIRRRSFETKDNLIVDVDFESLEDKMQKYKEQYESGNYDKEEIVNFIINNHDSFLVNKSYLNSYKPEDDLEFWINYYLIDENIRGNNRLIQKSILERINEKTFNNEHLFFGYSNTATFGNGIFYERDFIAQYFYLGILGAVILLIPYIFVCLFVGIKCLINIKKLDFEVVMLLLGVAAVLFISFLSGNSIEQFVVTIPLGIVSGYMLKRVKEVY